jgi:hypothetical protein
MAQNKNAVYYPVFIRLVVRLEDRWRFLKGDPFVNLYNCPRLSLNDLFACFATSLDEVSRELDRINNRQKGFYIANIKDKKYYFCGHNWKDVQSKLFDIGIGVKER